jgi:serine phosphatase RsbU (regulator of sigma subunit)
VKEKLEKELEERAVQEPKPLLAEAKPATEAFDPAGEGDGASGTKNKSLLVHEVEKNGQIVLAIEKKSPGKDAAERPHRQAGAVKNDGIEIRAIEKQSHAPGHFAESASAIAKRGLQLAQNGWRRARWNAGAGWYRLTNGLELNELWSQFKTEAQASTQFYRQEANLRGRPARGSWKRPFRVSGIFFLAVLGKLSPARRVFLLALLSVAVLAIVGFEFLVITRTVEFVVAFVGLLLLLLLVLGDHVTMKRDIEIAREIQRLLVPRVAPQVPGVDMAFVTRPANMVAGDYYDAFCRSKDGPLLLAVADVAGKSVPAAMMMANFQASLRALAVTRSSLSELVTDLNRLVCSNNLNGRRFTSAFLAELDAETGALAYLSAGHNPAILLRENGDVEILQSESIPLGIELMEKYRAGQTVMQPLDLLVIYTDGVTEARSIRGESFGETRLMAAMKLRDLHERAAVTLATILTRLDEFTGRAEQHDDITCLVVRRFSPASSEN